MYHKDKKILTIARVILTDSKILILDEATSSIDTRTEFQIQSAMDNLMRKKNKRKCYNFKNIFAKY